MIKTIGYDTYEIMLLAKRNCSFTDEVGKLIWTKYYGNQEEYYNHKEMAEILLEIFMEISNFSEQKIFLSKIIKEAFKNECATSFDLINLIFSQIGLQRVRQEDRQTHKIEDCFVIARNDTFYSMQDYNNKFLNTFLERRN